MHSIAFVFGLSYLRYSIFYYTHIYNCIFIFITFVIYKFIFVFSFVFVFLSDLGAAAFCSNCIQLYSFQLPPPLPPECDCFFLALQLFFVLFFCLAIVFWSFEIKMKTFLCLPIILYYTITINIQIKSFKSLKRRNLRFCFRIFSRNAENAQTIISMNSYKFLQISINLYLYL